MVQTNVAGGIHRIEDRHTNYYLVESDGGVWIFDCGLPTSWDLFTHAMAQLHRRVTEVQGVVLTHGHYDHMGFAERARRTLAVPVYVHENDVPLTRHPLQYGRDKSPLAYLFRGALPTLASFARARAFWPSPIAQVHRLSDSDSGPYIFDDVRALPTPGHTLGHCSFYFPERDTIIAGDALVTFDPYTRSRGPQIVSRAATADPQRAMESLSVLAETDARVILPGHGEPWSDGARRAVDLARSSGIT